jgi:hypothetical protein
MFNSQLIKVGHDVITIVLSGHTVRRHAVVVPQQTTKTRGEDAWLRN